MYSRGYTAESVEWIPKAYNPNFFSGVQAAPPLSTPSSSTPHKGKAILPDAVFSSPDSSHSSSPATSGSSD